MEKPRKWRVNPTVLLLLVVLLSVASCAFTARYYPKVAFIASSIIFLLLGLLCLLLGLDKAILGQEGIFWGVGLIVLAIGLFLVGVLT